MGRPCCAPVLYHGRISDRRHPNYRVHPYALNSLDSRHDLGTLLWGIIYGTIGMAVFWAWLERPFMALALIAVVVLVIIVVRRRQK